MAIAFSSTIHTLMSGYRVAGEQIAGFEIRYGDSDTLYKDVKTARMTLSGERDVDFAEANVGPATYMPDIDAVYAQLKAAGMVEIFPGSLLVNPSTFSVIRISGSTISIDIEGGDSPFIFEKDDLATAVAAGSNNKWKVPAVTFGQLSTAAAAYRESVDLELEDLGDSLAQEIVDRLAAVAAVQADVDGNESDADAAIAAEIARVDALIATDMWLFADQAAFPPAATNHGRVVHSHADASIYYSHGGMWHKIENEAEAQAARDLIQADVDQNEVDSDAADAALSSRLDVLEADPTTATAVAAVQADVDQNEADSDAAEAALSARLDVLEADPTTATAVAAVQADVDQNEADADTAIAVERGRIDAILAGAAADKDSFAEIVSLINSVDTDNDNAFAAYVLSNDAAVAAVQADVDQNESDADTADSALSGRLDVLEADPTTATALAAVQADVDQNEADADAALALKAPLADPDFTGVLEVDTSARLEFDSNLTKLHNVLRSTSIAIGNNIQLNPAAADGRVEIEGGLYLRPSDLVDAADDTAAAAAGVIVGQIYHNSGALRVRLS